jgi:hypothetical protein
LVEIGEYARNQKAIVIDLTSEALEEFYQSRRLGVISDGDARLKTEDIMLLFTEEAFCDILDYSLPEVAIYNMEGQKCHTIISESDESRMVLYSRGEKICELKASH